MRVFANLTTHDGQLLNALCISHYANAKIVATRILYDTLDTSFAGCKEMAPVASFQCEPGKTAEAVVTNLARFKSGYY